MGPYNGGGDGLTLVMKDEKSGYVNKNGEVIIPIEYDELSSFNEGIAVAKTGDKTTFLIISNSIKHTDIVFPWMLYIIIVVSYRTHRHRI